MTFTAAEAEQAVRALTRKAARLTTLSKTLSWLQMVIKPGNGPPTQVNVSWSLGSALPGYTSVNEEVARRVESMLPNILVDIRRETEAEIARLIKEQP